MVTTNALDLSSQGVAYYNGTGTFSGLDGSTSGKVLTSNGTGVAPSFQTFTPSGTGQIIQEVRTTSTTATSFTSALPLTGTTPTTSNTTSVMTVTMTPTNTNNILKFSVCIPLTGNAVLTTGTVALFAGSTLIKAFPFLTPSSGTAATTVNINCYAVAGTTSSTTYDCRLASVQQPLFLLETNGTTGYYNSTSNVAIFFVVTEVTP